MCVMIYKCELRYLKEQSRFRCKHKGLVSNLKGKQGSDTDIIPTIGSIQGLKTQIYKQLDDLEVAQLEVKNMCTRMVFSEE